MGDGKVDVAWVFKTNTKIFLFQITSGFAGFMICDRNWQSFWFFTVMMGLILTIFTANWKQIDPFSLKLEATNALALGAFFFSIAPAAISFTMTEPAWISLRTGITTGGLLAIVSILSSLSAIKTAFDREEIKIGSWWLYAISLPGGIGPVIGLLYFGVVGCAWAKKTLGRLLDRVAENIL
jgi:hypothetical protein